MAKTKKKYSFQNRTKLTVTMFTLAFVAIAAITAVITVFAFSRQTVTGSVKITYKAKGVNATVKTWYQKENGTKTYLELADGTDTLQITSTGISSYELELPEQELDSSTTYVLIGYDFTNIGSTRFAGYHEFDYTNGVNSNINLEYSQNGVNYDTIDTGFSLGYGETITYFFKASVVNMNLDAVLDGNISWELTEITSQTNTDANTDVARIGTNSYATFEDAYAAAASGDTVVIKDDVTLSSDFVVKNNVTIVADNKAPVMQIAEEGENDAVTITVPKTFVVDNKTLKIGVNNGATIKIVCSDTSATEVIKVTNNGNLKLGNVTLVPNGENQRGIFTESILEINGGSISNFTTTGQGGAIYIADNTTRANIKNCKITNNKAYNKGGAIYVSYWTSNVSIENCEITENTLTSTEWRAGAGILSDGSITVKNCKINKNTNATDGAGLYISEELTITDSEISENIAESQGGGICVYKDATIENTTITSNTAVRGGGIYVADNDNNKKVYPRTEVKSSNIQNNNAQYGGGIYASEYSHVIISQSTNISLNHAELFGGGIYSLAQNSSGGTNTTGWHYELFLEDIFVTNNTAGSKGAGIYAENVVTVKNSLISYNALTLESEWRGGAGILAPYLDMDNCVVSWNTGALDGGGIYLLGNNSKIKNSTISNNNAEDNGGGMCISSSDNTAETWLWNCTVENNSTNYLGGGIFVNSGLLVLENVNITNNVGKPNEDTKVLGQTIAQSKGGGVVVGNVGGCVFISGSISGNKLESTTSSGKRSITYGANVFVDEGGSFLMGAPEAYYDEDLLYSQGYKLEISGTGNVETGYEVSLGEGVYVQTGGEFIMNSGVITNCRSTVGPAITNAGTVMLSGGSIVGNLATNTSTNLAFTNDEGATIPVSSGIINAGLLILSEDNGGVTLDADICLTYQNITTSDATYGSIQLDSVTTNTYKLTFTDISISLSNIGQLINGTYNPQPSSPSKILAKFDDASSPIIKGYDASYVWLFDEFMYKLANVELGTPSSVDVSKFSLINIYYTLTLTADGKGAYLQAN